MAFDLLLHNGRFPGGQPVSIAIEGHRIVAIGDPSQAPMARRIEDLGGALVLPGLVDGHIHLDTSLLGDRWFPFRPGASIAERVRIQDENLAAALPTARRAEMLLDHVIARGTTTLRSHIQVDAVAGLGPLEAVLGVRERYRDRIEIQLVAFPQHGILAAPGTAEVMEEALKLGADVVGGLDPASFDRDVNGHLGVVFGLAERQGKPVDIHLHDPGELGLFQIEEIAKRTIALGMQGRVAISHAYALGMIDAASLDRATELLSRAGVAIMTNAPGDWPFPPVLALRAAGVTVFGGTDNFRDSWWPYGDGDMIERANMIGYRSGFYTDEELAVAMDLVTTAGAAALGIESYGLEPGCQADVVVVETAHVAEAVVARPPRKLVVKGGRVVARDGKLVA